MQQRTLVSAIVVMAALVFAPAAFGADVAKIGLVDFQQIFNTSLAGKKAQAEISKRGESYESELKNRGEQIEEERSKLEREALVMSAEMREQKERDFRIMVNDFKMLQKKRMTEFKEYEQQMITRIKNEVLTIVEKIGKKDGYLLILDKRGGGVLYAPGALDITDSVIQLYNEQFEKTGGQS